jgi:hypothetical protein
LCTVDDVVRELERRGENGGALHTAISNVFRSSEWSALRGFATLRSGGGRWRAVRVWRHRSASSAAGVDDDVARP